MGATGDLAAGRARRGRRRRAIGGALLVGLLSSSCAGNGGSGGSPPLSFADGSVEREREIPWDWTSPPVAGSGGGGRGGASGASGAGGASGTGGTGGVFGTGGAGGSVVATATDLPTPVLGLIARHPAHTTRFANQLVAAQVPPTLAAWDQMGFLVTAATFTDLYGWAIVGTRETSAGPAHTSRFMNALPAAQVPSTLAAWDTAGYVVNAATFSEGFGWALFGARTTGSSTTFISRFVNALPAAQVPSTLAAWDAAGYIVTSATFSEGFGWALFGAKASAQPAAPITSRFANALPAAQVPSTLAAWDAAGYVVTAATYSNGFGWALFSTRAAGVTATSTFRNQLAASDMPALLASWDTSGYVVNAATYTDGYGWALIGARR